MFFKGEPPSQIRKNDWALMMALCDELRVHHLRQLDISFWYAVRIVRNRRTKLTFLCKLVDDNYGEEFGYYARRMEYSPARIIMRQTDRLLCNALLYYYTNQRQLARNDLFLKKLGIASTTKSDVYWNMLAEAHEKREAFASRPFIWFSLPDFSSGLLPYPQEP